MSVPAVCCVVLAANCDVVAQMRGVRGVAKAAGAESVQLMRMLRTEGGEELCRLQLVRPG
jgi:hypothetical protein